MSRSESDISDRVVDRAPYHMLADRYELTKSVGSGGMAEVWEATDLTLGRPVAVKILHRHLAADADVLARFRAEAQAAARLTHPGIVGIYDTVLGDDVDAIIMEMVEGEDLRTILDERKSLVVEDAVEVATQLAHALGHAHQHSIVHRDVKPANILIRPDRRVKLSDFGIAKALDDSTRTETGSLMGTVKYLSPEQIDGVQVDGRADLYALATVLYEMISGHVPFPDSDLAAAMRRVREPATSLRTVRPDVGQHLDLFLQQALERNREHRPKDAAAFIAGLTGAVRADAASNTAPPRGPVATQPSSIDPTVIAPSPPSIPVRQPVQAASQPTDRPRERRPIGKLLGPLIAIVLMAAAVVTVWLLLQPASDVVNEQLTNNPSPSTTQAASELNSTTQPEIDEEGATTTTTTTTSPTTTTIAAFVGGVRTRDFDPLGDGTERPETTRFAIDGDNTTFWRTESYSSPLAMQKEGVGFILEFEEPRLVNELDLLVNNDGWSGAVFATDANIDDVTSLGQWGAAVGRFDQAANSITVPVTTDGAVTGVLLWITDLGPDDEAAYVDRVRLELFEIEAA